MGRVLVTGMSGAGKSTLLAELSRRGYETERYAREVEPLLERGATVRLDGRRPVNELADAPSSSSSPQRRDLPRAALEQFFQRQDGAPARLCRWEGGHTRPDPDPTCDTTPVPSAVTVIVGRAVVRCTSEVPLRAIDQSLENSDPTAPSRHFRASRHRVEQQPQALLQRPG